MCFNIYHLKVVRMESSALLNRLLLLSELLVHVTGAKALQFESSAGESLATGVKVLWFSGVGLKGLKRRRG